ncbi:CynX/NimT family MFS transporter [Sporomusa acidovorans]
MMAIIAILTGVVFAMVLFKVPPTMVVIMKDLNVGLTVTGLLMSMVAISSIVLALPGGAIMQKIGPKKLGLITIVLALFGNIIGAFAPNVTVLLISRLIEGLGFGLIPLVVPAIIAAWFPAEKRGLPMAIWTLWVSIGMLIVFNATNFIVPGYGWRGVWWFVTILLIVSGFLFATVIKLPEVAGRRGSTNISDSSAEKVSLLEGFKAPAAWMLAIIFVVFSFGNGAFTGFYPTFLVQKFGIDMATANSYTSIATTGMMVGGIIIGFLLNQVPNKFHSIVMIVCMAITGFFFYVQFKITSLEYIVPLMFIIGMASQLIPPVVFTMAPEASARMETIAATMGIISLGSNLGGMFSTFVVGIFVERSGGDWGAALTPLAVAVMIGLLATIILHFLTKKKYERETSHNLSM